MKHVTDTSRAARATILEESAGRETLVLDNLQRYRRAHGADPTAYELLRFLQIEHQTLDLNAVRPRLTELEATGRVSKGDKRQCAVTQKRVYTWAVVSPARPPVPSPEPSRELAPTQSELFR